MQDNRIKHAQVTRHPIARLLVVLLIFFTGIELAAAHALGQSYIFLRVGDQSLSGRLEIPTDDINRAIGLDLNGDAVVSANEVNQAQDRIRSYLTERFRVYSADQPLRIDYAQFETLDIEVSNFLVAHFRIPMHASIPNALDIEYTAIHHTDSDHRGWLILEENAKTGLKGNHATVSLIFGPHAQRQKLNLMIDPTPATWKKFIWEGTWHIWIGLDHVLFLIALVITAVVARQNGSFQPVVHFRTAFINVLKIVTLFTIGHSITLTLSALGMVTIPSRAVESVIAFSVFVVAINNIYPIIKKQVWWFVLAFGLFHGLGFASVLNELMLGQISKMKSLIGFNLGVELGQITIITIVFPLLFLIRNAKVYVPVVVTGGSAVIAAIALWWSVERAAGL